MVTDTYIYVCVCFVVLSVYFTCLLCTRSKEIEYPIVDHEFHNTDHIVYYIHFTSITFMLKQKSVAGA